MEPTKNVKILSGSMPHLVIGKNALLFYKHNKCLNSNKKECKAGKTYALYVVQVATCDLFFTVA